MLASRHALDHQPTTERQQASSRILHGSRVAAILLSALFLLLVLVSCNSVSESDLLTAGGLLLKQELASNYADEFGRYFRDPPWQSTPASVGRFENERIPEWARDQYIACVYWEDAFVYETSQSRPGPDLVIVRAGTGWGWILINKKLEFHILETGLRWTVTEDDVETESEERIFNDAWSEPPSS